jgi:DNA-binding transcriptional ArsR family regulator
VSLRGQLMQIYEIDGVATAAGYRKLDAMDTHVLVARALAGIGMGGGEPARELIAELASMSERAVKSHLLKLEGWGLLVPDREKSQRKGKGHVAVYRLNLQAVTRKSLGLLAGPADPAVASRFEQLQPGLFTPAGMRGEEVSVHAVHGSPDVISREPAATMHEVHGSSNANRARDALNREPGAQLGGNHARGARLGVALIRNKSKSQYRESSLHSVVGKQKPVGGIGIDNPGSERTSAAEQRRSAVLRVCAIAARRK